MICEVPPGVVLCDFMPGGIITGVRVYLKGTLRKF